MSVFGGYAKYYDLLYRDKDYEGETAYVVRKIRESFSEARILLELGSGTGKHAGLLRKAGYDLVGVEMSEEMVAQARERNPGIEFHQGDLRQVDLGREFDVVMALFHVISYQTGNRDLARSFEVARKHVKTGGGLIFDCWHGPAVMQQRPEVRVKRLSDGDVRIIRIAEPEMDAAANTVTVNYQVLIDNGGQLQEIQESHRMRYLFQPELALMLERAGFELLHSEEWMTGCMPGTDTWGVLHVARAV